MKRGRAASIDMSVNRPNSPLMLSSASSEQQIIDMVAPQMQQLVDLSNDAIARITHNVDSLGPNHAR